MQVKIGKLLMSTIRDIDATLICSSYVDTELTVIDNYLSLMYIMESELMERSF